MKNLIILFLATFVLGLSSCTTKKVEPNPNLSKTDLVSRTWVCEVAEANTGNGKQVIYRKGLSGNLLELKGSFVTFFNNGNYEGVDFYSVPQKGKWKFNTNETVAELDAWEYNFDIIKLTEKNLDFNTKVDYNGKIYDITVKMIPQQ